MQRIFMSYSHHDSEYATTLANDIRAGGIPLWFDSEIEYGATWTSELESHLDDCAAVVVVMSEAAKASDWVQNELARAYRKRKPIRLLLLGGDLPISQETSHFVDVSNGQQPPQAFLDELRALASALPATVIAVDASHGQEQWTWGGAYLPMARRLHGAAVVSNDLAHFLRTTNPNVLMLAMPFEHEFSDETCDVIFDWVQGGGGLLLMGHYLADRHFGANPSQLAQHFGFRFAPTILLPAADRTTNEAFHDARAQSGHSGRLDPKYQVKVPVPEESPHPLLRGLDALTLQSACSLVPSIAPDIALQTETCSVIEIDDGSEDSDGYIKMISKYREAGRREALAVAAWEGAPVGKGRVVAAGTWRLVTMDTPGNTQFLNNTIGWLSRTE